jgi:hypothetical protein
MYPKAAKDSKFDVTTAGLFGNPETWWIPKFPVDPQKEQEYVQAQLALLRPGGQAGKVSFQLDTSKSFDLSIVLPALFKLLSAQGNVNWSKKVHIQISASGVENRRLDWSGLKKAKSQKLIDDTVAVHLDADDYVITIGDLVLYDFGANLVVEKNLSDEEKINLDNAWKAFAQGSSVDFKFNSTEGGTFSVTSKLPVVAAIFVGEPPPGAVHAAAEPQVTAVKLAPSVVKNLEGVGMAKVSVK